jgi:hypothetical protein
MKIPLHPQGRKGLTFRGTTLLGSTSLWQPSSIKMMSLTGTPLLQGSQMLADCGPLPTLKR